LCAQQSSCGSCLGTPTCGWCSSSQVCSPGSLEGPNIGSCPSSWYLEDCIPHEPHIAVTAPLNGSLLFAGNTYTITWTGGKVNGQVTIALLRWDLDNLFTGAGLPLDPIPNTGSYNWTVQAGIDANYWRIAVLSESDPVNANWSGHIFLDTTYNPGMPINYYWYASLWTDCSQKCDGGIKTRDLYCLNSLGDGFEEGNCSGPIPAVQLSCNTNPCPDIQLKLLTPEFSQILNAGDTINITWYGGKAYGQVYLRFSTSDDPTSWKYGFGIPQNAINNTGLFSWVIDDNFPLVDGVQLTIYSESLNSTNTDEVEFGEFKIVKELVYTITLPVPAPSALEIQLVGTIGSSPTLTILGGQTQISSKFLFIGTIISIGVNDKKSNTTSLDISEIKVDYSTKEQIISEDKILGQDDPQFVGLNTAQVALIVCSSVAFVVIAVVSVIIVKKRRAAKLARSDKYLPLIEN